jgi:hypothetical protein
MAVGDPLQLLVDHREQLVQPAAGPPPIREAPCGSSSSGEVEPLSCEGAIGLQRSGAPGCDCAIRRRVEADIRGGATTKQGRAMSRFGGVFGFYMYSAGTRVHSAHIPELDMRQRHLLLMGAAVTLTAACSPPRRTDRSLAASSTHAGHAMVRIDNGDLTAAQKQAIARFGTPRSASTTSRSLPPPRRRAAEGTQQFPRGWGFARRCTRVPPPEPGPGGRERGASCVSRAGDVRAGA